jgi:hypothetical protein
MQGLFFPGTDPGDRHRQRDVHTGITCLRIEWRIRAASASTAASPEVRQ